MYAGRAVIKIILILIVVIVIAPVIYVLLSGTSEIAYAKEYIAAIQNYTAEAMLAKSVGDDILAGRSNQSMTVVQKKVEVVQKGLSELKVPEEFKDYKTSVAAWADEIAQASASQTFQSQKAAWVKVSSSPKEVSVKLNKSQAQQSLQAGIQHVGAARQFGDYAITTANTEAMRSVGARLFAQGYWFKVLYRAYPGDICADGGCLSVVWGEVPILQGAAFSFVAGAPDAKDKWQNAWGGIVKDLKPSGVSITGAGITNGKNDTQKVPPVTQTFFDTCKTAGGLVDDTGGVKMGLPTTEGGWTCWEPKKQCWHYLTYSGWFFKNGGPQPEACPKIDLSKFAIEGETLGGTGSPFTQAPANKEVPQNKEESKTQINQPSVSVAPAATWDGVYQINFGNESCSTSVSGGFNQTTITVSNNRIVSDSTVSLISSTSIDAEGKTVEAYSYSGEGYTGRGTETLTFSRGADGQITVSLSYVDQATGTTQDNNQTWTCSGTGAGQRSR